MRQDPNDAPTPTANFPGEDDANIELPGVDPPELRKDPQDDVPERLGERIARDPAGIATGVPDLLPDVKVPEADM